MKKNCYNCKFYGKCAIENYSCPDWVIFNNDLIATLNISGFNINWMKIHKKWYRKFDLKLISIRHEINQKFLQGQKVETFIETLENKIHNQAMEEINDN